MITEEEAVFSRSLSSNELMGALCKALDLKEAQILLNWESQDWLYEWDKSRHRLVCEGHRKEGEFPLFIRFIPISHENAVRDIQENLILLGRLCDMMGCKALVSDESLNPYLWILIHGPKRYQRVLLDPNLFNSPDNQQFQIIEYRQEFSSWTPHST